LHRKRRQGKAIVTFFVPDTYTGVVAKKKSGRANGRRRATKRAFEVRSALNLPENRA